MRPSALCATSACAGGLSTVEVRALEYEHFAENAVETPPFEGDVIQLLLQVVCRLDDAELDELSCHDRDHAERVLQSEWSRPGCTLPRADGIRQALEASRDAYSDGRGSQVRPISRRASRAG